MSTNLISIKAFLGKYHSELSYSAAQEKYTNTQLDSLFEQRFLIQNNKIQMVVDPSMTGLVAIVSGNEIHISKEFYDHPNIMVTNTIEVKDQVVNLKSAYNPDIFPTIAYLICQNHTNFQIVGEIDEPIYIKYKSDYETFYSSVINFEIPNEIEVEIIEEIESYCALNGVVTYTLHPHSKLNLYTFYQNHISALSYLFRDVISRDNSKFTHVTFGKGSSNIIDETRIRLGEGAESEFYGIINSKGKHFHSLLFIYPECDDYSARVDYRDILQGKADVTYYPILFGEKPSDSSAITVSNINLDEIPIKIRESEIKNYITDLLDLSVLYRTSGAKRFYDNKSKFVKFS